MSRFRIFVLCAALLALAATAAACGGGSEDPQQVLDDATLAGVKSGTLDISIGIKSEGDEGGDLDVSLSGPFQSRGAEDLPELDFEASAEGDVDGEAIDFEGGLTMLSDRAFVGYEGDVYEVDPTTFGFVKSAFEQAQREGSGEAGGVTACQEAAEGLEVRDFADELSEEGGADVDGASTTKVSGDLNVASALDAIIELVEDPACSSQLEAAGSLPLGELEEAKEELTETVRKAHLEVYVGEDDIIRQLVAEATIEPEGGGDKVEFEFEITLGGVNEDQTISSPSGAKPLEGLFNQLGVNPLELFEAGSSDGLEGLLEGLLEANPSSGGGGSSGGGSSSGGEGAESEAYLECLEGAETSSDLQKCANRLR